MINELSETFGEAKLPYVMHTHTHCTLMPDNIHTDYMLDPYMTA